MDETTPLEDDIQSDDASSFKNEVTNSNLEEGKTDQIDHSSNEVETMRPTLPSEKTWTRWNIAALWVSMVINIPGYMIGASLVGGGLTWYAAMFTVLLGNLIVLVPLVLNGHSGTKYGIPFPVFCRLMYGPQGSKVAAMVRGLIGCGWFGIQTWLGGYAIYQALVVAWKGFDESPYLGDWIGLNLLQFFCYFGFWSINMLVMYKGIDHIKRLQYFASPILFIGAIALFIWAWVQGGNFLEILSASHELVDDTSNGVSVFFGSLTGVIGMWATLSLNIMDFTRFTISQKDQFLGQLYGLPLSTTFFAALGIFVTSATILIYGKPIWNPIELMGSWENPFVTILATIFLVLATLTTNVAANIVSPANDFSNLYPQKITFKMGGLITGVIGTLIFPWKLIADPNSYVYKWLVASSSLLGSISGVMICDYFILRKTVIRVEELYNPNGMYSYTKGWNARALAASGLAVVPNMPGFIATMAGPQKSPSWLLELYNYAWFISFGLSFLLYWGINKVFKSGYEELDETNKREMADSTTDEDRKPHSLVPLNEDD